MNCPEIKPISPEDRKLWESQNLANLLHWASLPRTTKIRMLEEMEEGRALDSWGKAPAVAGRTRRARDAVVAAVLAAYCGKI